MPIEWAEGVVMVTPIPVYSIVLSVVYVVSCAVCCAVCCVCNTLRSQKSSLLESPERPARPCDLRSHGELKSLQRVPGKTHTTLWSQKSERAGVPSKTPWKEPQDPAISKVRVSWSPFQESLESPQNPAFSKVRVIWSRQRVPGELMTVALHKTSLVVELAVIKAAQHGTATQHIVQPHDT